MKKSSMLFPFSVSFILVLAIVSYAQQTIKIAIVNGQRAFESCAEGKKIMNEAINEAKKIKTQEQESGQKILPSIQRVREEMIDIVNLIAKEKGYDFVFDVSASGPVFLSSAIDITDFDITDELVRRYDASKAGTASVEKQSLLLSPGEKSIVDEVVNKGPGSRFTIKDLAGPQNPDLVPVSFGGPPPGSSVLLMEEDENTGKVERSSNIVTFSPSAGGFAGNVPTIKDLSKGSVVRFKGKVPVERYTFEGDRANPLSFVVIPGQVLVYLGGRGSVTSSDGKMTKLPPDGTK
jgi:Skp family chaperone for outer membrane proteins